jgi:hypothetical protein
MDMMPKDHKQAKVKKENPWLVHVKAVKAKHPGKSLKEVIMMAKESYTKKK